MSGLLTSVVLLASMLLHPGHSTRVEVQYNPTDQIIELAMRIDHSDLETALRKRYGRPLVIEKMTDDEASELIAPYLQQTLRVNGQKLTDPSFNWIGCERKRISTWVYAELLVSDLIAASNGHSPAEASAIELTILTLLETEPELNHVVAVMHNGKTTTTVTSMRKPKVAIPVMQAAPTE